MRYALFTPDSLARGLRRAVSLDTNGSTLSVKDPPFEVSSSLSFGRPLKLISI